MRPQYRPPFLSDNSLLIFQDAWVTEQNLQYELLFVMWACNGIFIWTVYYIQLTGLNKIGLRLSTWYVQSPIKDHQNRINGCFDKKRFLYSEDKFLFVFSWMNSKFTIVRKWNGWFFFFNFNKYVLPYLFHFLTLFTIVA